MGYLELSYLISSGLHMERKKGVKGDSKVFDWRSWKDGSAAQYDGQACKQSNVGKKRSSVLGLAGRNAL